MTTQETPHATQAVLYVCAARAGAVTVSVTRAREEGRAFAKQNAMRIVREINDAFGDPEPRQRPGWVEVREMARRGEIDVVIVRWPNALSPVVELQYPEVDQLGAHGVQIRYAWEPLAALAGAAPETTRLWPLARKMTQPGALRS
ncbi:recombinase family protein [Streptomyces sp. NPDC059152]|uniref:recombinase family protein n=1 Tax=Streptomyces sp. NPDC059152 TaxID=3346742 RepID=UPI0036837BC3